MRAALVALAIFVTACAGTPVPPRPSPPLTSASAMAPPPLAAPAPRLRPDPTKGTLELASAQVSAPRLRIDARGVRGELPKLGRDVPPSELFDLGAYGARTLRVLVAPPKAQGEALDARSRLVLVGSDVGEGHFRAVEGDDDAYWDGAPAFDPRAVFAELAGVRTALRERLKLAETHAVYTYLIATSGERPVRHFHVDRVPGALLLEVNPVEAWGTSLRIALATGLLQELWDLVRAPPAEGDEWFTFGVARAYARELLRRYGTLAPKELADDVNDVAVTAAGGAAFVAPEQRALVGDLFGFEVARELERGGRESGGLLGLLDRLFADARAGRAEFSAKEFLARVGKTPPSLAAPPASRSTRSVCFELGTQKVAVYTYPFAWESSRAARRVVGATPASPVKDGEVVRSLHVERGSMTVTVERDGAPVDVVIAGTKSPPIDAPKVTVHADVTDAACRDAP